HAAFSLRRTDALGRHLAPPAGRSAEVDNAPARFEETVLVIELHQLEGGPRAETFPLGAGDVRIVELALEPEFRRDRAALAALAPNLQRPLDAPVTSHCAPLHTRSSRIICTSMPSRSPRSAMRRRVHGKARRIASRMAQPASTRSARSRPMQALATRSS